MYDHIILTTLQFWEENLTTLIVLHRNAVISHSYYWSWSISKDKGTTFSWPDLASTKFGWRANARLYPFPKGDNNEKVTQSGDFSKILVNNPRPISSKIDLKHPRTKCTHYLVYFNWRDTSFSKKKMYSESSLTSLNLIRTTKPNKR